MKATSRALLLWLAMDPLGKGAQNTATLGEKEPAS